MNVSGRARWSTPWRREPSSKVSEAAKGKPLRGQWSGRRMPLGVVADELAAEAFVVGETTQIPSIRVQSYDGYVRPAGEARNERHVDVEAPAAWRWE